MGVGVLEYDFDNSNDLSLSGPNSDWSIWSISTENGNKYNNQLQYYEEHGWPKGLEAMGSSPLGDSAFRAVGEDPELDLACSQVSC